MRSIFPLLISACLGTGFASAQSANTCSDSLAAMAMMGNYNPADYISSTVITDPATISADINARVSPDSLHAYLDVLRTFKTRNSGSDTLSGTTGIGAARSWILYKFQEFSVQNESRLIPSYLQFDVDMCGIQRHKDVLAVLPGTDTSDKAVIIIEGHMDTRCTGLCDTACVANGMEDNGSGTSLVIELARVLSKYTFKRTIVFAATTGEEQGLLGAQALAMYVQQHGIKVKGVMNNDVIGGVFCGHTSSPPSCPGYHEIDSTQVRLFSFGGFNSFHKQLSRFIKLEYKELIQPIAAVPMTVSIMTAEDRTGRGGDHIPFRNLNYTAMRFTSANENGDANVSSSTYADRQHTSSDSLGIDVDNDGVLDTFFVDFNYLARNTVINGNAAAMMGLGPQTPDFTLSTNGVDNLIINITDHPEYLNYRIGVRTTTNDWDSVYTFAGTTSCTLSVPLASYIVSVASVDANGTESLFSKELMAKVTGVKNATNATKPIELLQNKPNPADEATMIAVQVNEPVNCKDAYISIRDLNGKEVQRTPITLKQGMNEIIYEHGYNMAGTYLYTLVIDGQSIESRRMVFTN
jgi:hypothetical protein